MSLNHERILNLCSNLTLFILLFLETGFPKLASHSLVLLSLVEIGI